MPTITYGPKKKQRKVEIVALSITKHRLRGKHVYLSGVVKTRSISRPTLKPREYPWKVRGTFVWVRLAANWRLRKPNNTGFAGSRLQLALGGYVCNEAYEYVVRTFLIKTATF